MDIPIFCIFLAFLLNYLTKIPVAKAMHQQPGGYDNHNPREQQAALTGLGKRALGAHTNSLEIFPAFACAVIVAHFSKMSPGLLSLCCIGFVISRVAYWFCYLLDLSTLRSAIWMVGIIFISFLYLQAIFNFV